MTDTIDMMGTYVVLIVDALACIAAACAFLALGVVWKYRQGDLRHIPSPPSSIITGHLGDLRKPNFHRVLSSWIDEYGPIVRCASPSLQSTASCTADLQIAQGTCACGPYGYALLYKERIVEGLHILPTYQAKRRQTAAFNRDCF